MIALYALGIFAIACLGILALMTVSSWHAWMAAERELEEANRELEELRREREERMGRYHL